MIHFSFLRIGLLVLLLLSASKSLNSLNVPTAKTCGRQIPACATVQRSAIIPSARSHSFRLFSTLGEDDKPRPPRGQKFFLAIQKMFFTCATFPRRYVAKFKSLSKKAKAIVAMQVLAVMLVFGGMAKNVYTKHYQPIAGPPVEIPYSSFLDLVERSGSAKGGASSSVTMDNVRISPDKLVYRLTQNGLSSEGDESQRPKQIMCYTHKVAASPELIGSLHKQGIPFSDAPRQRANAAGMAVRSIIIGFYMLILFRMYRTFSGNGGSGDTPGKLASKSSLPLASFNEIQGIDGAKAEVMELVDTLRNPDKYSILGARAPTGESSILQLVYFASCHFCNFN
jgi:hypothetical protein